MATPSYGSPDRPLVRFFFTATCPQLGLKGPVFRPPVGPEVPSFQENSNRLVCKICGSTVANVVELVEHWKVEVARSGGKTFKVEKTQGLPYAQVENIQVHQNSEQEGAESVLMKNAQKREDDSPLIDQIEGQVMYSTLDSVKKEYENENLRMKNQVVIKPAAATELWREFQLPVLFHFLSPGHWIMGIYNE